jgi:hypothetical protein
VNHGQLRLFVDSAVTYQDKQTLRNNDWKASRNHGVKQRKTCSEAEALTKKVGTLFSLDGKKRVTL